MFKRAIVAMIFTLPLSACSEQKEPNQIAPTEQQTEQSEAFKQAHQSNAALDWDGTYTGKLPCADCEGIIYTLTLNSNDTYTLVRYYEGAKNSKADILKGKILWKDNGRIITLQGMDNEPNQFFVGENTLFKLNEAGERIKGPMADLYMLTKE
ncbi:copper resistance protein NlpE [Providencia stuartii]|uniref:copper resistance protein NlpE n=1 Tax=Providencia stuartii TaxID=588 RepID=UPI0028854CC5|nr:copper resistance protein NlpE [Providencia stuartii]MDT1067767.1 copper resistance protein NlpE [Providencia stuartii]